MHDDPRIVAAAERQMQTWVRTQELADRAVQSRRQRTAIDLCFVTVSREAGAGGGQFACELGRRLGWPVLDKNLLDQVAERFHEPRVMLDLVDETPSNWVYDVLGTWMDRRIITHEKYVAHLSRVISTAARHGSVVLVGRGAQFLLPRDKTLAVRVVASEKYRIEQLMRLRGIGFGDARRAMQETDRGRQEFVQRFFRHDASDPRLYDLVLNMERLGQEAAVGLVAAALGR
jgi:cytidylate kinase